MLEIIFLLIQSLFAIYLLYYLVAFLSGAPFVPSALATSKKMVELSGVRSGMHVYDLGSGDGRILELAAARGARAIGFEINPLLVLYSNIRLLPLWVSGKAKTVWKDFWKSNLTGADAVFVYLLPWRMSRLQEKLKRDLKPGSVVVTNSFIFPDWKIWKQDTKLHVYAYKVE